MNKDTYSQSIVNLFREVISKKHTDAEAFYEESCLAKETPCLKDFFKFFATINSVLVNYKFNLYSLVKHQNKIMAGYYITGVSKKEFLGFPAKSKITASGIDLFKFDGDKISEYLNISHQIKYPISATRELVAQR